MILHIGPHKTGTTSLQAGLLEQRDWLAAQGYEYPELGVVGHGHHGIQALFAGKQVPSPDVTVAAVAALLRRHERVVLSSEDFSYWSLDHLKAFKAQLEDAEVQVVFFVRTPIDLWPSHWQELIRHGRDLTFMDYIAAFAGWKQSHAANIMNPSVLATKFATVFGQQSLRIFCYDNAMANAGDILDFFLCSVLGIAAPYPVADRRRANPSMPLHTIELLRCLNQRCLAAPGLARKSVLKTFLQQRATIEDAPEYRGFTAGLDEHGSVAVLDSLHEFQRIRERQFMIKFADRVENKAADNQLFAQLRFRRTVLYGEHYWTDRFGLATYIDSILAMLNPQAA